MPLRMPRRAGLLGVTAQKTAYHSGDDGDYGRGLPQRYEVLTLGDYAGNKNIEVACYAAATISFTVLGSVIADSANGLATILTGDTIVIKGSVSNNGTYTVAAGGVAAAFSVNEALAAEAAGAVVTLYKRTAHSNECVRDLRTGLMWSRNTSTGEKVGEVSTGLLIWADVTKVYTIYSSANTISCITPNIFRITGGAALTQFHVGDLIDPAGFVAASDNLMGYYVTAVTINGAALDIVIDPINQVLVAEGAVGDSIGLVCRSVFNYAAGARLIGLSGYTDWRLPNSAEVFSTLDAEAPTGAPDAVAFPGWPAGAVFLWTGTTQPDNTIMAISQVAVSGTVGRLSPKTASILAALVRG